MLYRRNPTFGWEVSRQRFVIFLSSAGAAKGAAIFHYFTLEIDSFAALRADNAGAFETGQIFRLYFHSHPLLVEKGFIGKLCIGFLLAGVLAEFREHLPRGLLG